MTEEEKKQLSEAASILGTLSGRSQLEKKGKAYFKRISKLAAAKRSALATAKRRVRELSTG